MPKPINYRPEQVPEFGLRGGSNTVFQQKAQNLAGLNSVAQELTDPIAEGILGAEAQEDRLQKFELEKNLPIEEIPPAEGGFNPFSLTKWGRTYDKSYNEIDKQLISFKAQEALKENSNMLGRPENQGPGITASYRQNADQIIKAYVDAAEPANRNDLMIELTTAARNDEFSLAEKEAARGRANVASQLDVAGKRLNAQIIEAGQANDQLKVAYLANEKEKLITSAQNLNFITPAEAQYQKEKIGSEGRQALTVGTWADYESRGQGDKFLSDIVTNPQNYNLTVSEAHGVAKTILATKSIQAQASADHHAMEGLRLERDMRENWVTSPLDFQDYDLTNKQVLQYEAALEKQEATTAKTQAKYFQARTDIENNQSARIDKKTVGEMFTQAVKATEEATGQPANFMQMADAITGGENAVPASGVRGLSLKTNVAEFDKLVSASLTSGDPIAMVQGALTYQDMVITQQQPNTLKLTDEAERAAIVMNSLIRGGVSPELAAKKVNDTILNADEPYIAMRTKEFNRKTTLDRLPSAFKSSFGANSDKNQQVYGLFVTQVKTNYAQGLDFNDAVDLTARNMRGFKESKYFPPGQVGNMPPEEAIPTVKYETDNELVVALQNIIDNGGKGAGGAPIGWANESDAIDMSTFNPEEWVDRPLPAVSQANNVLNDKVQNDVETNIFGAYATKLPEIKVGNHISKVYLISGPRVLYGDNGRPIYDLGYIDKSGFLQPISDSRGPNQAATFSPVPLDAYAPKFLEKMSKGERMRRIKNASNKPISELKDKWFFTNQGYRDNLEMIFEEQKKAPESEKIFSDYFGESTE
jgi:hypothetical protein